jgi:hypothetical protein
MVNDNSCEDPMKDGIMEESHDAFTAFECK